MVGSNTSKTEYFGYYVTHIKHYDPWNEYIHKTCTREVPDGTDSEGHTKYRTETYDCSYVDYHSDKWVMVDNKNTEHDISKERFNELLNQWKTPMIFIDMKRHYHTIDGDCQRYNWDNQITHSVSLTRTHSYTNKIQATQSIFKFEEITKQDVKAFGLYEYPKVTGGWGANYQTCILGLTPTNDELKYFNYVNGFLGKPYQFRTYLLCYYTSSNEVAQKQRSYWLNGNKNEFVICVGLDSITKNINWVSTFSWSDDKTLSIMVDEYLLESKKLNTTELSNKLLLWVPNYWVRKEFKDFDYLKPCITPTQLTWLSIILILLNIGGSVIVVINNIKPKES